jgi:hypothetical protein
MRKRSKYRPRPVLVNPVAYVIESNQPATGNPDAIMVLRIRNHAALEALVRGRATRADLDVLTAVSNITEALHQLGFGGDYRDVCVDGREAILGVVYRAATIGRFTPTGLEIQKLNLLMELHDAQLEIVTVRDVERAMQRVHKLLANPQNVVRMPAKGLPK